MVAGCSSTSDTASPATEPDTATTSQATGTSSDGSIDVPTATPANDPTASTPPSGDSTTSTEFVDVAPAGPCALTPAVPTGEVTWVQDGQLRALVDGGRPTCLVDAVAGTSPVSWSSDAGRVLLDPTRSATASGIRPTGFEASISSVTLSAPTGTASIAIDPATHRLIRHGSDGAVTDISFLTTTDEAIYHPSGKRIIAVGTSASGAYGIWLSSNLGADPKQILSVEDPSTPVTDLDLSADGQTLYFIHGFVHQLYVPALILSERGIADRREADLIVSKLEDAQAWTVGPCDASGTVLSSTNGLDPTDLRTVAGSPFASGGVTLQPVGWLSSYRLVLTARTTGCDGPADVWIWSTVDGFHQVAHDALAASARIPRGPYTDLPDNIEQAAPG